MPYGVPNAPLCPPLHYSLSQPGTLCSLELLFGFYVTLTETAEPAGVRQAFIDLRHRVSNNTAKQPVPADGGGISTQRRETPGFLPERGFLVRFIR